MNLNKNTNNNLNKLQTVQNKKKIKKTTKQKFPSDKRITMDKSFWLHMAQI